MSSKLLSTLSIAVVAAMILILWFHTGEQQSHVVSVSNNAYHHPARSFVQDFQKFANEAFHREQSSDDDEVTEEEDSLPCEDAVWCNIPMPAHSHFRFSPPTDIKRWRRAQRQAASGEPILLKRSIMQFPNYYDFLDGDILFRAYHQPIDYFIDDNHDFHILNSHITFQEFMKRPKKVTYPWETPELNPVVPKPFDIRKLDRAPVLKLGYFAFKKSHSGPYFSGGELGEVSIDRKKFMRMWKDAKDGVDTPFILLHSSNENWGLLSTYFPNRTANWGPCCNPKDDKMLFDFLENPNVLMFLVNQHMNITHPKLLMLPRGLPLLSDHNRKMVWDSMRILSAEKKNRLVFTSSSSWGYRPKISECLAGKFSKEELVGTSYGSLQGRLQPQDYYRSLGLSYFSVALPGLGYDTYRLWESMTIGTIPVLEKGVGFDRSLWKLPALLVDDFAYVTPELLREAYLEALYRAKEFEFERLKQSYWYNLILNVSLAKSMKPLYDKFPYEAAQSDFKRPFVRFDCVKTDTCSKETYRSPKEIC